MNMNNNNNNRPSPSMYFVQRMFRVDCADSVAVRGLARNVDVEKGDSGRIFRTTERK